MRIDHFHSIFGYSGGPLQCRLSKNGPWLLAGITSFGSGCAEQGYPDVYTRISYYIKWISDTISQTTTPESWTAVDGENKI